MTTKLSWLRCEATLGQFADELVISGKDHSGEEFSLFAHRDFVQTEQAPHDGGSVPALLRVTELAKDGGLVLVRLPGQTLANGQTITVRGEELEDAPAWQEA